MVQQAGFGLPNMGMVPPGVLESLYPYLTYLPNLTSQLAQMQFGAMSDIERANIQANASMYGDNQRANATVAAAGIGAGAQVDSQLIQTKGMLKATQASIIGDLEKARNGDIAAAQRLRPQLQQAAALANQATSLEVAKMMGSGQLRDAIGARLALRGMGPMPGISSALNGMENRLWVTAPDVETPPMYNAPKIDMEGLGGGGNYGGNVSLGWGASAPPPSGGGGGGGMPNLGNIYGDLFKNLQGTVKFGDIFKFGVPQTPTSPTPVTLAPAAVAPQYSAEDVKQLTGMGLDPSKLPADVASWYLPKASRGGRFGEPVMVGEGQDLKGLYAGTAEVAVPKKDGVDIFPIKSPMNRAAFGQITVPSAAALKEREAAAFKDRQRQLVPKAKPVPGADSIKDYEKQRADALKAKPGAGDANPKPFDWSATATNPMYKSSSAPYTGMPESNKWSSGGGWLDRMKAMTSDRSSKKFGEPASGPLPVPGVPPAPTIQPSGPVIPAATTSAAPILPLSDVNTIPALQQIRTGNVMPAFGDMPSLSEPGLGITNTPAPYTKASTFQAMAPADQEDLLQMWEMLGIPRAVALYQMMSATPGARQYPQKAFGFA